MNTSDSNKSRCRIIVDAMGGDYAPQNSVVGAIEAYNQKKDFDLYLVGKEQEILRVISENNLTFDKNFIINADEVIDMGDTPTVALKKKPNSSIVVGANRVKEKKLMHLSAPEIPVQ